MSNYQKFDVADLKNLFDVLMSEIDDITRYIPNDSVHKKNIKKLLSCLFSFKGKKIEDFYQYLHSYNGNGKLPIESILGFASDLVNLQNDMNEKSKGIFYKLITRKYPKYQFDHKIKFIVKVENSTKNEEIFNLYKDEMNLNCLISIEASFPIYETRTEISNNNILNSSLDNNIILDESKNVFYVFPKYEKRRGIVWNYFAITTEHVYTKLSETYLHLGFTIRMENGHKPEGFRLEDAGQVHTQYKEDEKLEESHLFFDFIGIEEHGFYGNHTNNDPPYPTFIFPPKNTNRWDESQSISEIKLVNINDNKKDRKRSNYDIDGDIIERQVDVYNKKSKYKDNNKSVEFVEDDSTYFSQSSSPKRMILDLTNDSFENKEDDFDTNNLLGTSHVNSYEFKVFNQKNSKTIKDDIERITKTINKLKESKSMFIDQIDKEKSIKKKEIFESLVKERNAELMKITDFSELKIKESELNKKYAEKADVLYNYYLIEKNSTHSELLNSLKLKIDGYEEELKILRISFLEYQLKESMNIDIHKSSQMRYYEDDLIDIPDDHEVYIKNPIDSPNQSIKDVISKITVDICMIENDIHKLMVGKTSKMKKYTMMINYGFEDYCLSTINVFNIATCFKEFSFDQDLQLFTFYDKFESLNDYRFNTNIDTTEIGDDINIILVKSPNVYNSTIRVIRNTYTLMQMKYLDLQKNKTRESSSKILFFDREEKDGMPYEHLINDIRKWKEQYLKEKIVKNEVLNDTSHAEHNYNIYNEQCKTIQKYAFGKAVSVYIPSVYLGDYMEKIPNIYFVCNEKKTRSLSTKKIECTYSYIFKIDPYDIFNTICVAVIIDREKVLNIKFADFSKDQIEDQIEDYSETITINAVNFRNIFEEKTNEKLDEIGFICLENDDFKLLSDVLKLENILFRDRLFERNKPIKNDKEYYSLIKIMETSLTSDKYNFSVMSIAQKISYIYYKITGQSPRLSIENNKPVYLLYINYICIIGALLGCSVKRNKENGISLIDVTKKTYKNRDFNYIASVDRVYLQWSYSKYINNLVFKNNSLKLDLFMPKKTDNLYIKNLYIKIFSKWSEVIKNNFVNGKFHKSLEENGILFTSTDNEEEEEEEEHYEDENYLEKCIVNDMSKEGEMFLYLARNEIMKLIFIYTKQEKWKFPFFLLLNASTLFKKRNIVDLSKDSEINRLKITESFWDHLKDTKTIEQRGDYIEKSVSEIKYADFLDKLDHPYYVMTLGDTLNKREFEYRVSNFIFVSIITSDFVETLYKNDTKKEKKNYPYEIETLRGNSREIMSNFEEDLIRKNLIKEFTLLSNNQIYNPEEFDKLIKKQIISENRNHREFYMAMINVVIETLLTKSLIYGEIDIYQAKEEEITPLENFKEDPSTLLIIKRVCGYHSFNIFNSSKSKMIGFDGNAFSFSLR